MEVENKEEFVKIKDSLIHHTQYTDVFLEVVTINEKLSVGLQGTSYFEDEPRLKSILVPIEAWTTLQTQAVPVIDKAIKEHQATHPAPPESAPRKRRPFRNGILSNFSFAFFSPD